MKKINEKILDYIVAGTVAVSVLGSVGYLAYDTIKNKTLTEKGVKVAGIGMLSTVGGIIYGVNKVKQDCYDEMIEHPEDDIKESDLEKEAQE